MITDEDIMAQCGKKTNRGRNQGTFSGRPFWSADPREEDIRIEDIAAQLACVCRFGGSVGPLNWYSVAQHSVLVSLHVPPRFALEGLLHDAAEAYVGDMVRPIKELHANRREIEDKIDRVIRRKFGLPEKMSYEVKEADYRALETEQRDLMPEPIGIDWGTPVAEPWPEKIIPLLPLQAYCLFNARWIELTGENK